MAEKKRWRRSGKRQGGREGGEVKGEAEGGDTKRVDVQVGEHFCIFSNVHNGKFISLHVHNGKFSNRRHDVLIISEPVCFALGRVFWCKYLSDETRSRL